MAESRYVTLAQVRKEALRRGEEGPAERCLQLMRTMRENDLVPDEEIEAGSYL